MQNILILFIVFFTSCAGPSMLIRINPYKCPSLHQQYKSMSVRDARHLDRKHHPFKKALPKGEKKETFGDDYMMHHEHHRQL
jgi:hypothetical protein